MDKCHFTQSITCHHLSATACKISGAVPCSRAMPSAFAELCRENEQLNAALKRFAPSTMGPEPVPGESVKAWIGRCRFVLAFHGEGASASVVIGWDNLTGIIRDAIGDVALSIINMNDPGEWAPDEHGVPYHFNCDLSEDDSLHVYRLSEPQA